MELTEDIEELLRVVCDIAEIREMKVTFISSVKSGLLVGIATTIGGLLFGPRGLALGGIIAGAATSYAMEGTFRAAPDVLLNDTTKEQKLRLAMAVKNLLTQQNILTVADFALKVATYDSIIGLVIPIVTSFLQTELKASIA